MTTILIGLAVAFSLVLLLWLTAAVASAAQSLKFLTVSMGALSTLYLAWAEAGDDPEQLASASRLISAMINNDGEVSEP